MAFILNYTESGNVLAEIIGSLKQDTTDERGFRMRADDLESLAADVRLTHRECPDVPHLESLAEALTGSADALIDRSYTMAVRRDQGLDRLENLRAQLLVQAETNPDAEEYVIEMRGSEQSVEVPDGKTLEEVVAVMKREQAIREAARERAAAMAGIPSMSTVEV